MLSIRFYLTVVIALYSLNLTMCYIKPKIFFGDVLVISLLSVLLSLLTVFQVMKRESDDRRK